MSQSTAPFALAAKRLIRYLRICWSFPLVIVTSLLAVSVLPAVDGNPSHPLFITSCAIVFATLITVFFVAAAHVHALVYWIDGTTLRVDQGLWLVAKKVSH